MDILTDNLEWMTLNVFLAILGVSLGGIFFYIKDKFFKWIIFLLWILFLPNTIYLVTDVQHIPEQWEKLTLFYQAILLTQYLLLTFIGVLTFILGFYFLDKFLSTSRIRKNRTLISFILFLINYLVAFGVALGRIERVHSFEAITNPPKVISSSLNLLNSQDAILAIFLFGTFTNFLFFFLRGKFKIKMVY